MQAEIEGVRLNMRVLAERKEERGFLGWEERKNQNRKKKHKFKDRTV